MTTERQLHPYESQVIVGKDGPTLKQVYELNEWFPALCQPSYRGDWANLIEEPHLWERFLDQGPLSFRNEPTWFIGGVEKSVVVRYCPLLPQDVKAFGVEACKLVGRTKAGYDDRSLDRSSKLRIPLPSRVTEELRRARSSGLFIPPDGHYGPSFLAVSYDYRVFRMASAKNADPIIIGWGHDNRWHVVAAWNIGTDLKAVFGEAVTLLGKEGGPR